MGYKAVIFDLDGTLVRTTPEYRYKVVGKTLDELGVSSCEKHIDRFWFGMNRNNIISRLFGVEPTVFWKTYNQHDKVALRKSMTETYHDVDLLKELKKNGYKTGIVTGAPAHIATLEIGMLGHDNFDNIVVIQSVPGMRSKPDPQGLHICMYQLDVKPTESIYVGNGEEDVKAAQTAGMLDVLLDRKEHDLHEIKTSLKIDSLYELRDLLGY